MALPCSAEPVSYVYILIRRNDDWECPWVRRDETIPDGAIYRARQTIGLLHDLAHPPHAVERFSVAVSLSRFPSHTWLDFLSQTFVHTGGDASH